MSCAALGLARSGLAQATRQVLKPGRGFKPDVLLVEHGGRCAVVKDYARRSGWVRAMLAPWLVRREQRILSALEAVAAVPRCLGAIDELAFAAEYRPGEPLSRALSQRYPPEQLARFLERLAGSIDRMHACGVVHLDLRHRDNVLLGEDGEPVIVDFGAAFCFRPGSAAYRWYRPTVLVYDRRALAKWRERLAPGAAPSPSTAWRRLRARRRRRPSVRADPE